MLFEEFWYATGLNATEPQHVAAHRWRFARVSEPLDDSCLFDEQLRIGACGDWCIESRVEGAFLSGLAVAGRLLGQLC